VDGPFPRQPNGNHFGYYGISTTGVPRNGGAWCLPGVGRGSRVKAPPAEHPSPGDVHLRSSKESLAITIQGSDEAIGHVDDFMSTMRPGKYVSG